ncbi:HflX GTPase family protein, partial [Komagataeibacter kakiaceti]|uniref:HflX GTPase family protein n=1 Tax=Komagataeibacter kakiaceti TaxID=943261 RepID=UPI0004701D90
LHRQARRRVPFPIVALVGYTNAGKSTLFNALTGASVYAQDQLFATLDPTMRSIQLPSGRRVILSDTVGFISDLPTELIAAFRATLEEVAEADIILHVRDVAHPDSASQRDDVIEVLEGMARNGTIEPDWQSRVIEVLNKADLVGGRDAVGARPGNVVISAITGDGLPDLLAAIDERMTRTMEVAAYRVPLAQGAAMAWLYEHGEVTERTDGEDGAEMTVRLSPANRARFELQFGALVTCLRD